ncbi:hypothetical protein Hanom_Chr05g00452711 [Helianthus anomalus]
MIMQSTTGVTNTDIHLLSSSQNFQHRRPLQQLPPLSTITTIHPLLPKSQHQPQSTLDLTEVEAEAESAEIEKGVYRGAELPDLHSDPPLPQNPV